MGYETLKYPWWINNVSVAYTGWGSGEPANFGSENCAIMIDGVWKDLPCVYKSKFICEKNETYLKLT
jgi:Lectin C-type domain